MDKKILHKKKWYKNYMLLAFLIPFLTYFVAYAIQGVFPFGDRQIMISDFWHQYYPFIQELQEKLQTGGSLLYSQNGGLGTNFLSLASYYLMSPLNILTVLVPKWALREAVTLIVMTKMGFAGLFMAVFLKRTFKREDLPLSIFASMYGLSAFAVGYGWNILWLDTFALMPLVMTGLVSLVKEGKYKLYIISLFACIVTNYYIGFIVCVFTFIIFFASCFCTKTGVRLFARRLVLIALCSLLAIAMTAVISIPAYIGLGNTYSIDTSFPTKIEFFEPFLDILGNLTYVSLPSVLDGLPNIYCGMICIFLLPIYFSVVEIPKREKISSVILLVVLFLSLNNNMLNFIWHAFHITNMIPYRFSFVVSFLLIVLAYRAFPYVKYVSFIDIGLMGVFTALFLICTYFGPQNNYTLIGGVIILIFYMASLVLFVKRPLKERTNSIILLVVMLFEIVSNTLIAYGNTGTSGYSGYPDEGKSVEMLLKDTDKMNRIEMTDWYTTNDPFLYGYRGVSQFSSMINVRVTRLMESMGLSAVDRQNRYIYMETSPFTNALLNIKYLISRDGTVAGVDYFDEKASYGNAKLLQNKYPLSLGFMTENAASYYSAGGLPFNVQNEIFTAMTGIEQRLFDVENRREFKAKDKLSWSVRMPKTGTLFVYTDGYNTSNLTISSGDWRHKYNNTYAGIICAGKYDKDDFVSFDFELREGDAETISVYLAYMNEDVFKLGYSQLCDEQMNITEMEDTKIKGKINVLKGGYFYTSIPYEKGWSATVDGEEAEIIPFSQAMCGLKLSKGLHTVVFSYFPQGLSQGIIISTIALWAYLVMCLRQRNREKR